MPPSLSAPPSVSVPPPPAAGHRWFNEHVQAHEGALRAWLRVRFPGLQDVDDLVQESLVRVWHATRRKGELENSRSYLFTVARNAAMDFFRRRQIAPLEPLDREQAAAVLEERPGIPETVNGVQELALLHEAIALLPDRCRQVMTLQKIHGRANKEIAEELGISLHTVNAQMVIGLMRCREYLRDRGVLRGKAPRAEAKKESA